MINWHVRILNKDFWLAMVPAVILLVQTVLAVFGVRIDLGEFGNQLLAVVNAIFGVLTIVGVAVDPTTQGLGDSKRAMGYDKPYPAE